MDTRTDYRARLRFLPSLLAIAVALLPLLAGGCGSSSAGGSGSSAAAQKPTAKEESAAASKPAAQEKKQAEESKEPAEKAEKAPTEVAATATKTSANETKKTEEKPVPPVVTSERFLLFTPISPLVVEIELTIDGLPHLAAMEKLIDEVIKLADTDGDGRSSWKELTESKRFKYGQFGNLAINDANGIKQILELYDTDRDGAVDRGEVPRFLTRNAGGARAFSIRGTSDFRDTNRYDSPLWNLLNSDEDRHSISAAEMAAAPARLRSRDTDDDDVVVPSDVAINQSTQPGEMPTRRRVRGPDAARVLGASAHWDMIRVALDEQYALGGNPDESSFPLTPSLFGQLDADKNGRLVKAEYLNLDKVPAHIRLAINFGKSSKSAVATGDEEKKPADGAVSPAEMAILSAAQVRLVSVCEELASAVSPAFEQPGRITLQIAGMTFSIYTNDTVAAADFEAQAKQALETLDGDKNGYLEAKEVPADAQAAFGSFEAVDTDEDAKVYPGEIASYLAQQQAALRAQIHAKAEDREDALFLALDENGDERLDGREIENTPSRLKQFDKNGDGEIVGDEIPAAMVIGFSRGSLQNPEILFAIPAAIPRLPTKDIPRWFTQMDTSGDGVIGRREFIGTLEQFEKLDANQDGFVDASETKGNSP